ncbi:hypothetical protein FisN_22Lh237 [Fistulifera solaris]|uniref:Uncharacterized protein n=1 Tax=Fistulifera solaris TaxID=1519565 RepID=A0A1Z5JC34_FISSO|nr:hypothetical protein FisN_22Lh237 [Fistulifera solaris]|eukprot:GAX11547.1 hypothetical protein FisN_22Lh237 [Fistulifera solaris]
MDTPGQGGPYVVLRPLESNVYPRAHQALHSPQKCESKNARPFLTLALLKLFQVLPEFLDDLATPIPFSVAKACARLESMATPRYAGHWLQKTESPASTPNSQRGHLSEPKSPVFQPLQLIQQMLSTASPISSHSLSPFSSPSESPSSSISAPYSPSALALEKEWERLVAAPFWLLAAAELFAADCCRDPSLIGLYQRCTQDLFRLQHLLCEPVLATESSQGDVLVAAQKVRALLDAVLLFVAAQSEFIRIQASLHESTDTVTVAKAATDMGMVLARLDAIEDLSLSTLFQRAYQLVQAWKFALEASLAVEQCLFLESIVLMRQWQHAMSKFDKSKETRQTLWLESCFKRILATLPVFLDRTRVHASSTYGLVNTKFPISNSYDDLEVEILEFLRCQEKLSGPPAAVAVVLDAEGTSNFHPEQGFCLSSNMVHSSKDQDCWPPVFIRSTIHSASSKSSSLQNVLPGAHSNGTSVPSPHARLSGRKTFEGQKIATTAMEYLQEITESPLPWPHSEWETLTELLEQAFHDENDDLHRAQHAASAMSRKESYIDGTLKEDYEHRNLRNDEAPPIVFAQREEGREQISAHEPNVSFVKNPLSELVYPNPVTYRDTTIHDATENDLVAHEHPPTFIHLGQGGSCTGPGPSNHCSRCDPVLRFVTVSPLEDFVSSDKALSTTSFHLVSISKWTTLVFMMKKDDDDSNRRLKRQQLSDLEIHQFLSDMADRLRVCLLLRKCLPESLLPIDKQTKEPILSLQRWARSIPPNMSPPDFESANNPKQQLYDPWMSDGRVSQFLDQVKGALGIRSATFPRFQPMNRTSSWWWGPSSYNKSKSPRTNQRRPKKSKSSSRQDADFLVEGAAALFLGPALSRIVLKND